MATKKFKMSQKGFTIVETLIVLSVTGLLFLTSSFLIRGQIERSRYQDGMRQLQQSFQAAIKDTENGYFPGAKGTEKNNIYIGKRVSFCGTTSCSDRTAMRVENLVFDKATNGINPESAEYYKLPNGLSFIGYYVDTGTEIQKSPDTNGVVIQFNQITYRTDQNKSTASQNNLVSKIIHFVRRSTLSIPAAISIPRLDIDRGDYGTRPLPQPPQPGDPPEIDVEVDASANANCDSANVYCGSNYDSKQSVGVIAYDGGKLQKTGFCFDGYRKGSLVIDAKSSGSVTLNFDDPNCQSGF
jgi:prepilin-type N-terminal cleavage/methylation domain-containing protein